MKAAGRKTLVHIYADDALVELIENFTREIGITRRPSSIMKEVLELAIPIWIDHQRRSLQEFTRSFSGESEHVVVNSGLV